MLVLGSAHHLRAAEEDLFLTLILQELRTYEHGGNDDILLKLRDFVYENRNDPAAREACENALIAFLDSDATLTAKMEVCRHLRTIGSEKAVPALQRLLVQAETSDVARFVLEKIPGDRVDAVLLQAMTGSQGGIKLGLISSLGHRRTAASVPDLLELAVGPDQKMAQAATTALGNIGSSEAVDGLTEALDEAEEERRRLLADALLTCADNLRANDHREEAKRIYWHLWNTPVSLPQRQAALIGRIAMGGSDTQQIVLEVLGGKDPELFSTAISQVPNAFAAHNVPPLCERLPHLPPVNQEQLLAALAKYPVPAVQKTAVQALRSQHPGVRIAALKALAKVGDASVVQTLVAHAALSRGSEQQAARTSLYDLGAEGTDDAILSALKAEGEAEQQRELLRAAGERHVLESKDLLFLLAREGESRNRVEATRALRTVASASDLPRLLDLLLEAAANAERQTLTNTVAVVAGKIPRPESRGLLVAHKLSQTEDIPKRCDLYRVLGKIGDVSTLPLLRQALEDPEADIRDAAVRALAEWPGTEPREDVLKIAQAFPGSTHQVLSLQAYIRMVGQAEYETPEEAVQLLQSCVPLLKRAEEKKALLGLLPRYPCSEALNLAESYLSQEEVKEEAEVAVERIKARLQQ
jgi:HEAT repeat protein